MNNDSDLLETNRFIADVDINLDNDVSYLNTEASYKKFLENTMNVDIKQDIKKSLLYEVHDDEDIEISSEDDIKTIEKHQETTFLHKISTIYSIDSRSRKDSITPNAYDYTVFLEKDFRDMYCISLMHAYIPYVCDVIEMSEDLPTSVCPPAPPSVLVLNPMAYLYIQISIEGVEESVLNTILVPIEDELKRKKIFVFAKVGLNYRNDGRSVYDKVIYGKKDFNDFPSIVKSASNIEIRILNPKGELLNSQVPNFNTNSSNNWHITLEIIEQTHLLRKTNLNTKFNTKLDVRSNY